MINVFNDRRLPRGARIPVRDVPGSGLPVPEVPDVELQPSDRYLLIGIARLENVLQTIARRVTSQVKRVDEYRVVGDLGSTQGETTVTVLPTFDTSAELIEAIIVTGPPSTAFTLNLGDRNWALLTDASGKMVMNGLGIMLVRADNRVLTGASAGLWTLELTGYADERF